MPDCLPYGRSILDCILGVLLSSMRHVDQSERDCTWQSPQRIIYLCRPPRQNLQRTELIHLSGKSISSFLLIVKLVDISSHQASTAVVFQPTMSGTDRAGRIHKTPFVVSVPNSIPPPSAESRPPRFTPPPPPRASSLLFLPPSHATVPSWPYVPMFGHPGLARDVQKS
jgi:hypothetical protein